MPPAPPVYPKARAVDIQLAGAEHTVLLRLGTAYARSHPDEISGNSGGPAVLEGPIDGEVGAAGLATFEYAEATFRIVDAHPVAQFLYRRPAGGDANEWRVIDASNAGDVSFPCSWALPLRALWVPDLEGSC